MAPPILLLGTPSRPLWGPPFVPGGQVARSVFGTTIPSLGPHTNNESWVAPVMDQFHTISSVHACPVSHGATEHAAPPETGAASGQIGMASHHASSIGARSAYTAELAQRQDTAEAKATVLEHRVITMAADTATAMRELMTGMREERAEADRVAAVVAAAQVSATDLSHARLTKMIGDSRADTLATVEAERCDTRDAIAALRDRMDLSYRDASSA